MPHSIRQPGHCASWVWWMHAERMDEPILFGPAPQTLLEFTTALGNTIRRNPALAGAWVAAELSDVSEKGGHCYMELIEKNEQGATVAKMRANIWRSSYAAISYKFRQATGRQLASGLKVLLRGSATHHNIYGLSFNITDIDPSYTLGDMERLRRELLDRLTKEGVINRNKELEMPAAPQRIAVISAAGAAGYGDFVNQLEGNHAGFVFYTHLFEAVMQGGKTSASIRSALERVESTIDLWDCVAIIRGGGSTSDLNGFDDLELARAVAMFPLPIVVGIGHERDRTVLDEIAHTRQKTPTAVAAYFIETLNSALAEAESLTRRIATFAAETVAGENRLLFNLEKGLPLAVKGRLREGQLRLERIAAAIPGAVKTKTAEARMRLMSDAKLIGSASSARIEAEHRQLRSLSDALRPAVVNCVAKSEEKLRSLNALLDVLSPEATLRRGYTITRAGGKAVTDASRLSEGTLIETIFVHGRATSRVVKPQNNS